MFTEIPKGQSKGENYQLLLQHLDHFLVKDDALITSLSNLSAYLNYFLDDINWVGFYLYDGEKLFLGPFQGLPACTTIAFGSGVCGTAAKTRKTIVVEDVDQFEGHIACDANSKSEIVVPIINNTLLFGVLDIDSPVPSRFDQTDHYYLEEVINKFVDIVL
ncbi:GAF domain-containing protein [Candidatus Xianfuyuplasma coldseepsis]|uniref:GAF domain-containing protein n=1 Tax=Candidatus Xianfuyuplasma coldseepsis TaxID=2782163 RepID=A0A7L7KQ34_9MOLU|nr:GAF domain-containing protein [Xianfuyuplasma coldseepsis]QMS84372.1 GAF domain-containing protein [Xianfuyuplasma coldseepsis]